LNQQHINNKYIDNSESQYVLFNSRWLRVCLHATYPLTNLIFFLLSI